jgi:hypothetical protein
VLGTPNMLQRRASGTNVGTMIHGEVDRELGRSVNKIRHGYNPKVVDPFAKGRDEYENICGVTIIIKSCPMIEHIPRRNQARSQGSDGDRHEYVVMALLCLQQCSLSLKREDGSRPRGQKCRTRQKEILQLCKAGTPGDHSRVTSSFLSSKFLSAQTEFDGPTFILYA